MKPMRLAGVLGAAVVCCFAVAGTVPSAQGPPPTTEAPTGFDRSSNGQTTQDKFRDAEDVFSEHRSIEDGVGPVYNGTSCADCHENPVPGGNSQVFDLRAGHNQARSFFSHPGGSLIQSRAVHASIQERVIEGNEVRALRASLSTLGLGFVEAIADDTLRAISTSQPSQSFGFIRGVAADVPILEDPGRTRVGRFGWKDEHASLLSFASAHYVDEIGITTPLNPAEQTSNGHSIADFDNVPLTNRPDLPDDGDSNDLEAFVLFMRSTKAPPRDLALAGTLAAVVGETIFNSIGCTICHVPSITTAPAGTLLNSNRFAGLPETLVNVVSHSLGNKVIHPYSDFLLHDVGTGDGIRQGASQATRVQMRTSPLWGLRTRSRFMHDGLSFTIDEAILRHGGESLLTVLNYRGLTTSQRNNLLTFLFSL